MKLMKVRIKTLEEFGGKRPGGWCDGGEMDFLFGAEIDVKPTTEEADEGLFVTVSSEKAACGWCLDRSDFAEIYPKGEIEAALMPSKEQ